MTLDRPDGGTGIPYHLERRTFRIRYRNEIGESLTGTAFAIERGANEYLVTAHHVVNGITARGTIEAFPGGTRREVTFARVGTGTALGTATGVVDVAVLKLGRRLFQPSYMVMSSSGLVPGQRVYLLGFPARQVSSAAVNLEVGKFTGLDNEGRLLIEASAAKGMSGGPVLFVPREEPIGEPSIAGILAHVPPSPCSVPMPPAVVAYDIHHATELIDANPLGQ